MTLVTAPALHVAGTPDDDSLIPGLIRAACPLAFIICANGISKSSQS